MLWIVLTILFALVVIPALLVFIFSNQKGMNDAGDGPTSGCVAGAIGVGGLVLWLIMTLFVSIHKVDAGHVGVIRTFGAITGDTDENAGLIFTAPWQSFEQHDVRNQKHKYERLEAASVDTQDVYMTVTVQYRPLKSELETLLREVGSKYREVLIDPRVENDIKDATVAYSAIEITQQRDEIRQEVDERLTAELAPYGIEVVDLQIENIAYSEDFEKSIEEKQVATQNAEREEERVNQARFEAQQAIERATGEAEANRIVSESLSPEIIQLRALQALGDNVTIALLPSGQGVIIDPTSLLGGSTSQPEGGGN